MNQIDDSTINERFRNSVRQATTYPSTDCGGRCDHVRVLGEMRVKLESLKKSKIGKE